MHSLRIGVDLAALGQPFKKALHTAAGLGAEGVEIDGRGEVAPQQLSQTALRQLRKMLEDLGLRVAALRFRTRRGYSVTEDLERRVAATKAALAAAHALGAGVVINHVGPVPPDRESPQRQLLVEVLGDLGRHGQRVGARLAAETATESGQQLAELLSELPDEAMGADLNPAALLLHGFSPIEAAEALGPRILHVHATDAVRDPAGSATGFVPLGRGAADLPGLLGALDGSGYRGYLTIQPSGAADPQREAAEAVEFLRRL